ncbi:MAG TPA: DUF2190 family protein [Phycisphaerae bacterium]|nr:DUF2190 family protein [Phycisphaerae bacterium]
MADNWINDGRLLNTANDTGADVEAGMPIIIGAGIRVALNDIDDEADGPAYDEGVFELPAKSADTWSDGVVIYWDATEAELTDTSAGNTLAGTAVGAKVGAVTYAQVKLRSGAAGTVVGS